MSSALVDGRRCFVTTKTQPAAATARLRRQSLLCAEGQWGTRTWRVLFPLQTVPSSTSFKKKRPTRTPSEGSLIGMRGRKNVGNNNSRIVRQSLQNGPLQHICLIQKRPRQGCCQRREGTKKPRIPKIPLHLLISLVLQSCLHVRNSTLYLLNKEHLPILKKKKKKKKKKK